MKEWLKAALGILAVFVVVGCQSPSEMAATNGDDGAKVTNGEGSAQPGYESPVPVTVTEDDGSLPAGCSTRQAAAIVATFVDAFNRGDQELLDRVFQPLPESRVPDWASRDFAFEYFLSEAYAEGKYRDFDFDYGEKDRLLDHFAERHRIGERLQLWKVQVNGLAMEGAKDTIGMSPLLSRRAPDLKPGLGGPERLVYGKGSIDCENQTIFGWVASMEMVGGEKLDTPPAPWVVSGVTDDVFCKEPDGWEPGESVLACT
ncbi:MAG: hypothetical protein ACRDSJ_21120 [Rubrobacteraceae bacterium]